MMRLPDLPSLIITLFLLSGLAACTGGDSSPPPDTQSEASGMQAAGEAHEHGEDTHTHEMAADTAGTYADSTSAYFGDETTDAADHEHGPETHEH